jgi:hypothetical protein
MKMPSLFGLVVLSMNLAACGGSDGGIASAPPPVVATAPSASATVVGYDFIVLKQLDSTPAWKTGTYDMLAYLNTGGSIRNMALQPPGSASISVDRANGTYSLTLATGTIPVTNALFRIADAPASFGNNFYGWDRYIGTTTKSSTRWSDGVARPDESESVNDVTSGRFSSTVQENASTKLHQTVWIYGSVANRHVSYGSWQIARNSTNADGTISGLDESIGAFIFGERTAAGAIPVSGTASYAVSFGQGQEPGSAQLTANFAARTMSAVFSQSYVLNQYTGGGVCCYGWEDSFPDPATKIGTISLGTQASGTAPFGASGSFDLPISGTGLVQVKRIDMTIVPDISVAVAGRFNGAFFGPQANELGGAFDLPNVQPDGSVTNEAGLFLAVQTIP